MSSISEQDTVWDDRFDAILRSNLRFLDGDAPLAATDSLADLGLDSMQMVQLVLDLEDELGVVFPDESLTMETFSTAGTLWSFVLAQANGQPDAR